MGKDMRKQSQLFGSCMGSSDHSEFALCTKRMSLHDNGDRDWKFLPVSCWQKPCGFWEEGICSAQWPLRALWREDRMPRMTEASPV